MRRFWISVAVLAAVAAPRPAAAEKVTLAVYAPSMSFESTSARVSFARDLAARAAEAFGDEVVGKVFASARDLSKAVRSKEIVLAVVDPYYLVEHGGSYVVIGELAIGASHGGRWQLVGGKGITSFRDLKGKELLVPAQGGGEGELVYDALFDGQLPPGYFAAIRTQDDAFSTVRAVALGKASGAVVPVGTPLPEGVSHLRDLEVVGDPVLVAYGLGAADRAKVASKVASFQTSGVDGIQIDKTGTVTGLRRRMADETKRGPMVIPTIRMTVSSLVTGRSFAIERSDIRQFAVPVPARRAAR